MTNTTHLSSRLSWLELLCACIAMLAWAAPVLVAVSGDMPEFLKRSQDHQANDPADMPAETEDASDDPIMFLPAGEADLLPLMFTLRASQLTEQAWSPPSPVPPPNNLNSF